MELIPEIEKRVSVRKFTGEAVTKEQMDKILEAGRRAPSAKNRQAWRFIVVNDQGIKDRMQEAAFGQEWVGQAGAIIALCTTNVDYRMPNGQLSYSVDISIASTFMMLQAVHEDLGTCLLTTFDEQEVKHILTVPYSMKVVMLLLLGPPAEEARLLDRLPLERIVAYNHW